MQRNARRRLNVYDLETLRHELRQELRQELSREIRQELRQELRQEIGQEIRQELRQELGREIRQELRQELRQEIRQEIRQERIQEPAPQQTTVAKECPKTAVLVLDETTEVPLFVDVTKIVVDLARCQELRQTLTATKVRQVLLIVPYTTDATQQSTWQTVINDVIPPTNVTILVCPAPRPFLRLREFYAFADLLDGLWSKWNSLTVMNTLQAESTRPKALHGLQDEQSSEETAYWRTMEAAVEKAGHHWPKWQDENEKERRERLQLQTKPSEDNRSEAERVALAEKCVLRYKRLEYRFGRVELLRGWSHRCCYKRWKFEEVKWNVEKFPAQQLDDFWHRMDRWEAWVRNDEFWILPLVAIDEVVTKILAFL